MHIYLLYNDYLCIRVLCLSVLVVTMVIVDCFSSIGLIDSSFLLKSRYYSLNTFFL